MVGVKGVDEGSGLGTFQPRDHLLKVACLLRFNVISRTILVRSVIKYPEDIAAAHADKATRAL